MTAMAPISGPPAFNFYSALSGLGDTLQKNAELRQKQQRDDARKAAFSTLDPNSKDFGDIATQGAVNLLKAGDMEGGVHMLTLAQAQKQRDQAQANADRSFNESSRHNKVAEGIALSAEHRAAEDYENTPDQYVANPKAGQPGEPALIDQYAQASAAAQNNKPVPFETLGGTKFMVKQGDGYRIVDPVAAANANPASPATPPVVPVASPQTPAVAQPGASPVAPAVGPVSSVAPAAASPGAPPESAAGPPSPQAAVPAAPADLTAIDPATGRREAWLKSQSPDVQAYIKKIADYEIDPRTTSIKGGHREQVLSAVAQYDPTYDQNTFGSRAKAVKDFSTGPQGNSIRSFDVATDHLDTLQKYVAAAKNGDYRAINSLRQKWLAETGSPLPTNIQAVAPIVGAEVSKAIIGSNNALADREELRKPLNSANSPDQLMGAIQAYKALMTGQLKGLSKQYEDTTGRKDFNNRLRENTRNVLLSGDGAASSGQSGPDNVPSNVTSNGVKWSIQ